MGRPKRIQRQRTKGWRMPEGAVYVGRPSGWGNPYRVGETYYTDFASGPVEFPIPTAREAGRHPHGLIVQVCEGPAQAVAWYAGWANAMLRQDHSWLAPLRGRDLACWCPLDQPCHADVLLELANPSSPDPSLTRTETA